MIKRIFKVILSLTVAVLLFACESSQTEEPTSTPGGDKPADDELILTLSSLAADETSVTIKCIPSQDDATYILLLITEEYYNQLGSDEKLIEDDKIYFEEMAKQEGISVDELIGRQLRSGEHTGQFSQLNSGTSYYVYAYGLNADGTVTSDLYKLKVETKSIAEDFRLTLAVDNVTSSSAHLTITPNYDTYRYFYDVVKKSDYEAWGGDANTIAQNIEYIEQAIWIFAMQGYDYTYDSFTDIGGKETTYGSLVPSTQYVFFAFGLDSNGNPTSPLAKQEFETSPFEATDDCTFDITFSDVTATSMNIDVVPSNPSTRYYVGMCQASNLNSFSPDELAQQFIDSENNIGTDWADTEFVFTGEQSLNSADDLLYDPFVGNTEYAAVVFGVDEKGERTTVVTVGRQRTASPQQSQMTFSILVNSVTVNGAKVVFLPSTDEETYFTDVMDYETFSKFTSDDEIVNNILDKIGSSIDAYLTAGQHTVDCSNMLVANTRYVAYCFGYNNGVTTRVFSKEFTTEELKTGSDAAVAISYAIDDGRYYGYDGCGVIFISMMPNATAEKWYAASYKSLDGVDDDTLTQALLANGYENRSELGLYAEWGTTLHFATVATDSKDIAGIPARYDIVISQDAIASMPMSLRKSIPQYKKNSVRRLLEPEKQRRMPSPIERHDNSRHFLQ